MQGEMRKVGNRKSKEGNKLGSWGSWGSRQTSPTSQCCQQTAVNLVCLGEQDEKELVSCPRKGHRPQVWVEKGWGRSGQGCVCCLLSVTSSLCCDGGENKEGGGNITVTTQ